MKNRQFLLIFEGKPVFLKRGTIQVEPDGHWRILKLALYFICQRSEVVFGTGMQPRPFESVIQARPHFRRMHPKLVIRNHLRRFDRPDLSAICSTVTVLPAYCLPGEICPLDPMVFTSTCTIA
jgi:hypothetical protein